MAYEDTLREYIKLAKRADQRLVRLEKLANEDYYKNVDKYIYKRAMTDIKKWSGVGARRFNRDYRNLTEKQLKAKMTDIKVFLNSPTSTKKGITKTYEKRAQTVNERYGTNLSWQDISNYYQWKKDKGISSIFGSKTEIKAYDKIKTISNDADTIKKVIKGIVKIGDDSVQDEIIKSLLEKGVEAVFPEAKAVVKAVKVIDKFI